MARLKILTSTNSEHFNRVMQDIFNVDCYAMSNCITKSVELSESAKVCYSTMFPDSTWEGQVSKGIKNLLNYVESTNYAHLGIQYPEARLHDSQISTFMQYLIMARPDITLVIATQSEFVLNAVRVAIAQKTILPSDVEVCHYHNDTPNIIEISPLGRIFNWGENMFDQTDRDYNIIFQA